MNKKDSLGDRMKMYESVSKTVLMKRTPVIIRLDGKAFHTFTKGFDKPFDKILVKTMQETLLYLCKNIQGCVYGYTQSDEITLVLCDYQTFDTCAWFDYEVQKLCSIASSMCTMQFNKVFSGLTNDFFNKNVIELEKEYNYTADKLEKMRIAYSNAIERGAMFDARCFNVPKEEVTNSVLWRQQDCTRNSIQSVGQYYFSHKELMNKSCNNIQDMLHNEKGVNWNDYPVHLKRGTSCVQVGETMLNTKTGLFETRMFWHIDEDMPILTGEGREYIESLINF